MKLVPMAQSRFGTFEAPYVRVPERQAPGQELMCSQPETGAVLDGVPLSHCQGEFALGGTAGSGAKGPLTGSWASSYAPSASRPVSADPLPWVVDPTSPKWTAKHSWHPKSGARAGS